MARRGRHNGRGQSGTRTAKAGELIRRVVAGELELLDDERLDLVSLTGVRVDRDLHRAVVYFTSFDRDDDPEIVKWQEDMDKVHNLAEVIVAKQRHGPIGKVTLHFEPALTKFSTLARPDIYGDASG